MSTVTANTRHHVTSDEALRDVRTSHGIREIEDSTALTIASWWQSPGNVGRVLAQLSTTGSCDVAELLDDIHRTYREADTQSDRDALDMLATWALNHPSRGE